MKTTFKMLIFVLATLVCLSLVLGSCGGDEGTGTSSSTESSNTESSVNTSESTNDSTPDSSTPSVDESKPTDSSAPVDESKPTDSSVPTDESKPTDSSTPEDKPCDHTGGTATCTAKAMCDVCGEEYGDFADHVEQYDVIAPTCVANGITNVTCENCAYFVTKDETPATGVHVYDAVVKVIQPDCLLDGYTLYGCSAGECGTTEKRDEETALGHEHTVFVEEVEPTCALNGYNVYKCVRCDDTTNVASDKAATGIHDLEFFKTVEPTCAEVGYNLYKCKNCDLTWKNPDATTPNEPVPEEIVDMIDHDFSEATVAGVIECYGCGNQYRDITSAPTTGEETFCMGCGKEPCECGSVNEWGGYTPPEAPFELAANTAFSKTGIQIGGGLIVLTGESDTEYAIEVFYGETSEIIDVKGESVYVYLGEFADVIKVEITATTDAFAQLYVVAK